MTAREPWCDAREYLQDRADEVEGLIAGMPPERQAAYRATSRPHNALKALDGLTDAMRVYVLEVNRAATALAGGPENEDGYDLDTIISALGYMGALHPGHDDETEYAEAVTTLRAALGAPREPNSQKEPSDA